MTLTATAAGQRPMTGPRVLALDLSLSATGVATPAGQLDTVRPTTEGDRRLVEITGRLITDAPTLFGPGSYYDQHGPDLVVIEGPVVRSSAAIAIGMLQGAVRSALVRLGVPYLVVPPASVKTYATGRGNAPKPDLRMSLYKRTGLDVADDNQVDAAWLRLLALDLAGAPEVELPQQHRRALDKLALPAEVRP